MSLIKSTDPAALERSNCMRVLEIARKQACMMVLIRPAREAPPSSTFKAAR